MLSKIPKMMDSDDMGQDYFSLARKANKKSSFFTINITEKT